MRFRQQLTICLGFLLALQIAIAQATSAQPSSKFDLTQVVLTPVLSSGSGSLAFLDENLIALCWHSSNGNNFLYLLSIDGNSIRSLSPGIPIEHQFLIHRVGDQHIVTIGFIYPISELFSVTTQTRQSAPFISNYLISASGKIAGNSSKNAWTIYQLEPAILQLRSGKDSSLLSVSDEKLAIRQGNVIRIESLSGQSIGEFNVKPASKCATELSLLNQAVYLATCNRYSIVDWNGRELVRLHPPSSSGYANKLSEGGTRILFDWSTRHVSPLRSVTEVAEALGTLGVGAPDQHDNGEEVRVIDAVSGRVCFDWKTALSGAPTVFAHSDLSPSGQSVAIAVGNSLELYRLPGEGKP
jgi:hypothetical protein